MTVQKNVLDITSLVTAQRNILRSQLLAPSLCAFLSKLEMCVFSMISGFIGTEPSVEALTQPAKSHMIYKRLPSPWELCI